MRRIVSVLVFVVMVAALTGCAGSLGKRIDRLEILYENSKILQQETANMATSTGLKVDKMENTLNELCSSVTEIRDEINFIPPEAMETASDNSTSAEPAAKPEPATKPETTAVTTAPSKAEAKTAPTTLEGKLDALTKRVNINEERLSRHDRKFGDLQRTLAEVKDELGQPVYLWTDEFYSGLPKKPGDKEKLQLPDELKPGLDRLAWAIVNDGLKLEKEVGGHTDPVGSEEDNLNLSKRRAQACINYLVAKIGPDKEIPWEAGTKYEDYFVAVGKGETDRYGDYKYNRRVCFKRKK